MFPILDTKDTTAVKSFVESRFAVIHPGADIGALDRVFNDMNALFKGEYPDYSAADLRYHDWEHTLQATLCLTLLLDGRAISGVEPRVDARHFELTITAMLLHDSGYIKLRSDVKGTGAKYTFCHVLRSCAFAATYLPSLGASDQEIEAVLAAINCTGPTSEISRLRFREPVESVLGSAVATADFLGQMSAPDYPDELPVLFEEFEESDRLLNVPPERRAFQSADDLARRTPQFWYKFVRPRLETDFQAVYRFLANPYPGGDNPYLDAVETNISEIQRRVNAASHRMAQPLADLAT